MKGQVLQTLAAVLAITGGVGVDPRLSRARARQARPRESIDDVLKRARARRGKAPFDPALDGRVR